MKHLVITKKRNNYYDVIVNEETKSYLINMEHRSKRNQKSKWTVYPETEVKCFEHACYQSWLVEWGGWGLVLNGDIMLQLGVTRDNLPSKIAKFVDSSQNGIWHGYPADYQRNHQDRPAMKILERWKEIGVIDASAMRKIRGGQKCNL